MINNKTRRWLIIIAAIPIIIVLLYVGGIISQLISGYQNWFQQDGMMGGLPMDSINFNFFYCLGKAFTKEGLTGILVIIAAAAITFIYFKIQNRFGSKEKDDRNFKRSKSGVYGTAGWMTPKEMKSVLEVSSPENANGTILGHINGSVICLPENTRLNKHICVFGASGTMKSRAIIRPYLFQSIKRGESIICSDPKGELYSDTAEMFRRNGYTVRVFNLVNPEHSDSWNCMAGLDGDTMTAQILTNVIISNTGKGRPDHFWDNGEGNLLKSLILYIDQEKSRSPDEKNLPAVYQMLTQNTEKTLSSIFDKLSISHPAKAPYNLFAQASDTVKAGIVLGLGTRLQVMQNQAIRNITSKSELDLEEPGKSKCAYFVILSDQESSTEFISSLFFSILFIKLARYADSLPNQKCKVPVNIVFDEFNNIGQLDTYPRRLSVVRSRAIQVCHVVQSLAQFKNRYPDEQWAEIIGNCDTQIMLGCTEEQTAEYFSARSGDMTVDINSTMTVKQTITIAQIIPQYRHTEGMGKRRLLTPDEVLRIPNDEMLIIIRGEKVLRVNKFDFTGHPYAKRMIQTSVMDYYPSDKRPSQTETKTPKNPGDDDKNPETAGNKPILSQTENKKSDKSKKPAGSNINNPFYQTEPENSLNTPEDNPDTEDTPIELIDYSQTDIENPLDKAERRAFQDETGLDENESDINADTPPDPVAQQQKNQEDSQIETNNNKKTSQRAGNQIPDTNYTQLLESFKQQSNKKSKQNKKDSNQDNQEDQSNNPNEFYGFRKKAIFNTDKEDTDFQNDNPDDFQTENESPLVESAEQIDLFDLSTNSYGSSDFGNDSPPDDF